MNPKVSIAYFVTPHGFGHAARACAVMNALHELRPVFHFEIFTTIPQWFFSQSLKAGFTWHPVTTDIGLVQTSALDFDLAKTIDALNFFLPFDDALVEILSGKTKTLDCQVLVCDISPLGIAVGKRANIPSILIENFTWDWIYETYISIDRSFDRFAGYIKEIYDDADYRIQAEPACDPRDDSLQTPPIARATVSSRQDIRSRLGILNTEKMVLITLAGFMNLLSLFGSFPNATAASVLSCPAPHGTQKHGVMI